MKITVLTIKHDQQRYSTCGDWQNVGNDNLLITVSELGDWKMEACLGVHELCEALICRAQGVSQASVDLFDMNFTGEGEPGDHLLCPYRVAHRVATGIEFLLSLALGVDWTDYESRLNAL